MKKTLTLIFAFAFLLPTVFSQSFKDDFESYKVGDYLGLASSDWTTWNGNPGTKEDIVVVDNDAYSGTQSIYYDSPNGNGPQDIVLPFGGVHNTGKFKFTSMFKIPKGNAAYFNFQGGTSVGSSWAMDFYLYDNATFQVGKLSGAYPQDQWFQIKIEIDFASNRWEVFIDNVSMGTFSSGVNAVSYLDIYGVDPNSSFWVDDVTYCINNSCNPDLVMNAVSVNPSPLCSNHKADVTIDITNNGPDNAKGFILGLDMDGQSRISYKVVLDDLAAGSDTTITIPSIFKTHMSGAGLQLRAINVNHDLNELNDTTSVSITVMPSPDGSSLIKSSPFQGTLSIGNESQPDLIEVGKSNKYQLLPPKGYTNSNYSSKWVITSVQANTSYGVSVPSSAYTFTYPTSLSDATISFTGLSAYLDSNITFSFGVASATNGCDSIVSRTIRVIPTPHPNFSFPSSICLGDFVQFENKTSVHSGFVTYKWYFGDGDTSDNTNPLHDYKTPGLFNVRLVATTSPYVVVKDTSISVNVGEIPVVKFKATNKCEGIAVDFQNQTYIGSGTLSYDWDFGDGSLHSAGINPIHLYNTNGVYKAKLVASANGCSASFVRNVYTFARPVSGFIAPTGPVCAKIEIVFNNTSTIASGEQGALWTYGDGNISTLMEGKHTYSSDGSFFVKLKSVSEFGCTDSMIKTVVIKPTPVPNYIANKLCSGEPTNFQNTTVEKISNPVYTWTFSDNTSYTTKNVSKNWPNEGTYSVTLKADFTNGCSGSVTRSEVVRIQPSANFTVKDICSGDIASFVNMTTGDKGNINFSWDLGNGTSTETSPRRLYNPAVTTTYVVQLVAAYSAGCSDTISKNITVSQSPVATFATQSLGYLTFKFTPTNSTYTKYEWFFGEGGTDITQSPTYKYAYAGLFPVNLVVTNSAGCQNSVTNKVSATSSVNQLTSASALTIYPNPNAGLFTVSGNGENGMKIEVYNLLGTKILSQVTADNTASINLGDVAKGIYLVKVTIDGASTTSKITVAN